MVKKIVTFGEIMLRLSPPGYQRFSQARSFDVIYGGGEANVAVSLANYGLALILSPASPGTILARLALPFYASIVSAWTRSCAVASV